MNRHPLRDFIAGVFVLIGLGAVAYLSISVGGVSYGGPRGLTLYANFDELGGLKARAPVVVSGVKVGSVTKIGLNKDYRARVTMDLNPSVEIPVDSSISIVTSGLLGDRYLSVSLGGEDATLKNGEDFSFTESAILLERLIGKFVYGKNDGEDK